MGDENDVKVVVDPNIRPKLDYHDGKRVSDEDKTPVYLLNKAGRYLTAPRWLADEKIAKTEAIEITPDMPDYVDCVKKALGYWEGFAPGKTIQMAGKWVTPEEIGRHDNKAIIDKAIEDSKKFGPKGDGSIVIAKDMPTGAADFDARLRKKKFGR